MARAVGGHLAIHTLQFAQAHVSLLLFGPLKVSPAMLLKEKVVKQQQNKSFSLGGLVGTSPCLRSKGKGVGSPPLCSLSVWEEFLVVND